jgi:hypothetical protein
MAEEKKDMVTLMLSGSGWIYNAFESNVPGVDPITPEGTPVPPDKVAQVKEAAGRVGLKLKERQG